MITLCKGDTLIGKDNFSFQVENVGADLRLKNQTAALKDLVKKLDQIADLIVLLVHAGFAESEELASAFGDSFGGTHNLQETLRENVNGLDT